MNFITRWTLRGVLGVATAAAVGWAPIFDWMSPQGIVRDAPQDRSRPPTARLVVLISIDGLAPRFLATTPTPRLDRLASGGSVARDARTVLPSITMTSHASMLSGVAPQVHRIFFNRYQPWSRVEVTTIFSECRLARLRCGLFAGKRKFAHFAEFEAGVERYRWAPDAHAVFGHALEYIAIASPDFVMIHLAEVDLTGHDDGWGSEPQRRAIRMVDEELGEFVDRLSESVARPVAWIVTADHGGHDQEHGSAAAADVEIPWMAWGDGVAVGRELTDVHTEDTAATALSLLGIDAPRDWTGRARL